MTHEDYLRNQTICAYWRWQRSEVDLAYFVDGGDHTKRQTVRRLDRVATSHTCDYFQRLLWTSEQVVEVLRAEGLIESKKIKEYNDSLDAWHHHIDEIPDVTSIDDKQILKELESMADEDEDDEKEPTTSGQLPPLTTLPPTTPPVSAEDTIKDDNWMVTVDLRREEIMELVFHHAVQSDWWKCNGMDPQGGGYDSPNMSGAISSASACLTGI